MARTKAKRAPTRFCHGMLCAANIMHRWGELQAAWEILRYAQAHQLEISKCSDADHEMLMQFQQNPQAN